MSHTLTLHVNQPSALKHAFTITDQTGKIQGTLTYVNSLKSGLHTRAEATYGDYRWTFTAKGFAATYVDIVDEQTETIYEKAYKKPALSRQGTIQLDEKTYGFRSNGLGFLRSHYSWMCDGNSLIKYTNGGFIRTNGNIEITSSELDKPIPLLVMLGLFIGLNADDDSAVVAGSS